MIRIYFDWNVISSLKKPEFTEINEFIFKHKEYLQFPYSPAHFTDLMKSYSPNNKYFDIDLETLDYLSNKHLIRWGKEGIEPLFGTPKEYFKGEKNKDVISSLLDVEKLFDEIDNSFDDLGLRKLTGLMKTLFQLQPTGIEITDKNRDILTKLFPNLKSNSTMWDFMKDIVPTSQKLLQDGKYYKDIRKSIAEQGLKLESNSGNWSYDKVIGNIDDFFLKMGIEMTYLEYVESSFKTRKEPINKYEYYTRAYILLDMIGYKIDKLPKPSDNMQNIQADGEHSFYAAYCDFFVAMDKNLRIKSRVLYNEFNISTKIIEPKDLIYELSSVIDNIKEKDNFLIEAIRFCKSKSIVEYYPAKDDSQIETASYKLPKFYFNFFNYVVYRNYPKQEIIVLTFKKIFKNFSTFIYYTESETLIDALTNYFGYDDKAELETKKNKFVYSEETVIFDWNFENGIIRLSKDEDTRRPILNYIIYIKEKEEKSD